MRAALYARVSTEDQAEQEIPLAGQIEECRAYAAANGWTVTEVFKDEGISGRTDARPAFQQMIVLAKQQPKPFDVIVVWKHNRLSRRVEHALVYKGMLRRRGIQVVSVKEPEIPGAIQMLVETILAAVDEFLCVQVGEDTLRGQKEVARQGYSAGGRPPRGLRSVKKVVALKRSGEPICRTAWEPDPEWRHRALLAFDMAARGRPSSEICEATHVVSNKSSLSSYLRNKAFIGYRVFNRRRHLDAKSIRRYNPPEQVIEVPDAHEAIIPRELFNRVQQVLNAKRPTAATMRQLQSRFILTGLLWCPTHQCNYVGYSIGQRDYYICSLRNKGGKRAADCPLIKREPLENFILEQLREEVFQPDKLKKAICEVVEGIRRERQSANGELAILEAQIRKVEQELDNLFKAIKDGIPAAYLADPIKETQAKLSELRQRKGELTEQPERVLSLTDDDIEEITHVAWGMLGTEDAFQRKLFVRQYVKKIEVFAGEVTLHYAFCDPRQEVVTNWLPGQDSNLQPSG